MTRDETVALFLACETKRAEARAAALADGKNQDQAHAMGHEAAKAHWNSWAEALLAEYREMEDAFTTNPTVFANPWDCVRADWLERAQVDFSFCSFLSRGMLYVESKPVDKTVLEKMAAANGYDLQSISIDSVATEFDGFLFPGVIRIKGTNFNGGARFRNAVFSGPAEFSDATFDGWAWFDDAIFKDSVHFRNAGFTEQTRFSGTKFFKNAEFKNSKFGGSTFFGGCIFYGDASFLAARFEKEALFSTARFNRDADFWGAIFKSYSNFERTFFKLNGNFRNIRSEGSFSLIGACFLKRVPDFISSQFSEPVLLDNVHLAASVEPGGLLQSTIWGIYLWIAGKLDTELSAKYRALKQLATKSDDYRNEQIFFRGELRARRHHEYMPWHPTFLFGIFYELFSDFGHAIWRPLLLLIILGFLSCWFYLGQHLPANVSPYAQLQTRIVSYLADRVGVALPAAQPALSCKHGEGDPIAAAALLAVHQSTVIGALDRLKIAQIYTCLYSQDAETKAPVIPDAVAFRGTVQAVFSAALWFLLLLGLRNQFKIK